MTKIDKNLVVGIATNKDMKYGALVLGKGIIYRFYYTRTVEVGELPPTKVG